MIIIYPLHCLKWKILQNEMLVKNIEVFREQLW